MARLWSCGFELQSVGSIVTNTEVDTTTGGATVADTTIKRSGAASLKADALGDTSYVTYQYKDEGTSNNDYLRFYLYIGTASDTNAIAIALFRSATSGNLCSLRLNTNNTLELWNEQTSTQLGSDSSALSTSTWYRIELEYNRGGSGTTTAYINGVQFATGAINNALTTSTIRLGVIDSATCILYFDDVAVNDSTGSVQNSLPGDGKIVHLHPSAAGDNNTWLKSGGGAGTSTNWQDVDEVSPDNATTYLKRTTTTIKVDDYNVTDSSTAGINSSDTITLVSVGIVGGAINATASTARDVLLRLKSASGGTVVKSGSSENRLNVNGWVTNTTVAPRTYKITSYTDPTTGVAWTPTGTNSIDNMQIGVENQTSSTTEVRVTKMYALVEYVPVTTATIVTQDTAIGLTMDNTTISQNHVIATNDIAHALTIDNATITQNHIIVVQDIALAVSEDNTTVDHNHVLTPADIAHALTADNTTISQNHVITTQDVALALTTDNTTITQNHIVVPADIAHSLTTDNTTVTETNFSLVAQDVAISLTEDNTTITQNHVIASSDVTLALATDNTTLTQNHIVVPQDIAVASTTDNTTIVQEHSLTPADITITLTADNTTVVQTNFVLTVQDVALSLTTDNTTISQNHVVATQDIAAALTTDNTTITQNHIVATQDIAIATLADNATVTAQDLTISPANISHALYTDEATISQVHVLTVQDITLATTEDNTTISQNHVISPADIAHALTADNTTIVQTNVVLTVQDVAITLSADNTSITQNHVVATQDIAIAVLLDSSGVFEGEAFRTPTIIFLTNGTLAFRIANNVYMPL